MFKRNQFESPPLHLDDKAKASSVPSVTPKLYGRRRAYIAVFFLILLVLWPLSRAFETAHLHLIAKDYRSRCDEILRTYPYLYPAARPIPPVPVSSLPWRPDVTEDRKARLVKPAELLANRPKHARIIHQSWKTSDLSSIADIASWRLWQPQDAWRSFHHTEDVGNKHEWLYVLWSDEDNRELVKQLYPQYLEGYDTWPHGISRADFVRNLYMHAFGGIYADLDYMPLVNFGDKIPAFRHPSNGFLPLAYIGEMYTGRGARQFSIPNAWMASTGPSHPFWLAVANHSYSLLEAQGHRPEKIEETTGPVPLRDTTLQWVKQCAGDPQAEACRYRLRVLDRGEVYPFSWDTGNKAHKCICLQRDDGLFNAARCNAIFPEAWAVTYWSSSWWAG